MTSSLTVIGVDVGCTGLPDADRLVRELAPSATVFACTHLIRGGRPRIALSFALPSAQSGEAGAYDAWRRITARQETGGAFGDRRHGPADLAAGAAQAAAEHTARTGGRVVLFPGSAALTGTVTVVELLTASGVDEVTALGAPGPADPGRVIVTREHVRPEWRAGRLVLTVMPAVGGTLVPFEAPDPTPCCADH
ncbi:hypothetical protein ACIHCQ_07825 [Streptomyces sp. NPDC052236]|uniref:hypothetical protein n=1 Tax=Streptomyces sp. NPDC052236 TaxID=3365686 RepID=UPI0037D84CE5